MVAKTIEQGVATPCFEIGPKMPHNRFSRANGDIGAGFPLTLFINMSARGIWGVL